MKLFVDSQGEFESALTKKAINQSFPSTQYIYMSITNKKVSSFFVKYIIVINKYAFSLL